MIRLDDILTTKEVSFIKFSFTLYLNDGLCASMLSFNLPQPYILTCEIPAPLNTWSWKKVPI